MADRRLTQADLDCDRARSATVRAEHRVELARESKKALVQRVTDLEKLTKQQERLIDQLLLESKSEEASE